MYTHFCHGVLINAHCVRPDPIPFRLNYVRDRTPAETPANDVTSSNCPIRSQLCMQTAHGVVQSLEGYRLRGPILLLAAGNGLLCELIL